MLMTSFCNYYMKLNFTAFYKLNFFNRFFYFNLKQFLLHFFLNKGKKYFNISRFNILKKFFKLKLLHLNLV